MNGKIFQIMLFLGQKADLFLEKFTGGFEASKCRQILRV